MSELKNRVLEQVNLVTDLETGRSLGQLNVVRDVDILKEGTIRIVFSPTSPYSPVAFNTGMNIKKAALGVSGVKKVQVVCEGHMQDDVVNKLVNS